MQNTIFLLLIVLLLRQFFLVMRSASWWFWKLLVMVKTCLGRDIPFVYQGCWNSPLISAALMVFRVLGFFCYRFTWSSGMGCLISHSLTLSSDFCFHFSALALICDHILGIVAILDDFANSARLANDITIFQPQKFSFSSLKLHFWLLSRHS